MMKKNEKKNLRFDEQHYDANDVLHNVVTMVTGLCFGSSWHPPRQQAHGAGHDYGDDAPGGLENERGDDNDLGHEL